MSGTCNGAATELRRTRPFPNVVLTRNEVATWLKVKPRQVERLGVPYLDLGRKTQRYLREDVERWLEKRRKEG